jgi:hypothetical protein
MAGRLRPTRRPRSPDAENLPAPAPTTESNFPASPAGTRRGDSRAAGSVIVYSPDGSAGRGSVSIVHTSVGGPDIMHTGNRPAAAPRGSAIS